MNNVVKVKPRRERVLYRGLHGWVEYVPTQKLWRWQFKAQATINNTGEKSTKDEAIVELKKFMEVAAISPNIRSID